MKAEVVLIQHCRRKTGANQDTRKILGINPGDNCVISFNGKSITQEIRKIPLSSAKLCQMIGAITSLTSTLSPKVCKEHGIDPKPRTAFLFIKKVHLDELGAKTGDIAIAAPMSEAHSVNVGEIVSNENMGVRDAVRLAIGTITAVDFIGSDLRQKVYDLTGNEDVDIGSILSGLCSKGEIKKTGKTRAVDGSKRELTVYAVSKLKSK